jgi:GT2 family glycosyltransferase
VQAQDGVGTSFLIETIVVDDGSTDGTPELLRAEPAVRSIRLPSSRGVSVALNEGVRASTGVYLTFLGDDDEWLPRKLATQVALLETQPEVGVVYGQALVRFGSQEHLYPDSRRAPSGWVFGAMLDDNFCGHHAALLVRREALARAGSFDETLATFEDFDLSLRLARCTRFLFAPGAVTIYNLSSDGSLLSGLANGRAAADAARVVEKAARLVTGSDEDAALEHALRARDPLQLAAAFVPAAAARSSD